jgi:hypothetical protein
MSKGLGGIPALGAGGAGNRHNACLLSAWLGSLQKKSPWPGISEGLLSSSQGVIQDPQQRHQDGIIKERLEINKVPGARHRPGREATLFLQVFLTKGGPVGAQMGIPTVFTWSLSPSRL